jgi:hypothetical protein
VKVSSFATPYIKPRQTRFISSRWQAGVYLIKENGTLVYVGYAGECLYRTLYRHFQNWTSKSYHSNKVAPAPYRVSYRQQMSSNTYEVRLIHCSKKQASRLEKVLILRYNPRDNRIKYQQYELDKWDKRIENTYAAIEAVEQGEEAPF